MASDIQLRAHWQDHIQKAHIARALLVPAPTLPLSPRVWSDHPDLPHLLSIRHVQARLVAWMRKQPVAIGRQEEHFSVDVYRGLVRPDLRAGPP